MNMDMIDYVAVFCALVVTVNLVLVIRVMRSRQR